MRNSEKVHILSLVALASAFTVAFPKSTDGLLFSLFFSLLILSISSAFFARLLEIKEKRESVLLHNSIILTPILIVFVVVYSNIFKGGALDSIPFAIGSCIASIFCFYIKRAKERGVND
jgi:hypothetical protein